MLYPEKCMYLSKIKKWKFFRQKLKEFVTSRLILEEKVKNNPSGKRDMIPNETCIDTNKDL